MSSNAARFQALMNWEKGEEILYREYPALIPAGLVRPPRHFQSNVDIAIETVTNEKVGQNA
jgi:hypothetical protein